jgi:hypothetical protein
MILPWISDGGDSAAEAGRTGEPATLFLKRESESWEQRSPKITRGIQPVTFRAGGKHERQPVRSATALIDMRHFPLGS